MMKEEFIKNSPLFAHLSEEAQRAIGKRLRLESYRPAETLFQIGSDSDTLYLIKEGWVKLVASDGTILANLGSGSLLGEADFFLGQSHAMAAQATTDVTAWALTTSAMTEVIDEHFEIGLALSLAMERAIVPYHPQLTMQLSQVQLLQNLSPYELAQIAQRLIPRRYYPHGTIYRDGEAPQGIFFIDQGIVRLLGQLDNDFTELMPGDAFGEMAVLSNKPHAYTAQAATETIIWQLSPTDFTALVETTPSIKTNLSQNLSSRLDTADQAHAISILKQIGMFANLDEAALNDMANLLLLRHVPAGQIIFPQGAPGDAMYIIDSGVVDTFDETPGRPTKLLARLTEGEYFGEAALLTGKTRGFTAYSIADTNLWGLYRADFDHLLVKYPQLSASLSQALRAQFKAAEDYTSETHLQKIAILGGLSRAQLDELSSYLRPDYYRAGGVIYQAGQPADKMYFISKGQIEHWVATPQGAMLLETFKPGDFLGEIGLISGKGQPATAQVVTDSEVWVLTKNDFDRFLSRYPMLAMTFSRLLSERLDEVMNRMRNASGQRGLPVETGHALSLPPVRLKPVNPSNLPVPVRANPPVPLHPMPPSRPQSAPPRRISPAVSPNHSQFTQPMAPMSPPSAYTPPIRPSASAVHGQHTQPLRPTGPVNHSQLTQPLKPTVHGQHTQPITPTNVHSQHTQAFQPANTHSQFTQGMPAVAPPVPPRNPSKPTAPTSGTSNRSNRRPAEPTKVAPTAAKKRRPKEKTVVQSNPTPPPLETVAKPAPRTISTEQRPPQIAPQMQAVSNRKLQKQATATAAPSNRTSVSMWFAKRTIGAKFRLLFVILFVVWLCGIMLPWAIMDVLAASLNDGGALPGDNRTIAEQMRDDGAVAGMAAALPFVETTTPTTTPTPTPTDTPTATSTSTMTPIPTNTPTPTDTTTPTSTPTMVDTPTTTPTSTGVPTETPIPQTSTPRPPTDTPTPEATATPNVDFRLVSIRELTPCENKGKHHIFVHVIDPSGQGINGLPIKIQWSPVPDGFVTPQTETKTNLIGQPEAGHIDFAMFKGTYQVQVMGGTSDIAEHITPDFATNRTCEENGDTNAISLFHSSFEVTFQRTY